MSYIEQYATYFPAGTKVGVGIPMQSGELFRDWALIQEIQEDVLQIQLSRDVLPADVDLQTGKVLEVRCGKEGKGYRCSGVFVSAGGEGNVWVRLTGDVNSNEMREFYRIDAFWPFKIEISKEQNPDAVLKEWRTRKQNRLAEENLRREELKDKRRDLLLRTAEGSLTSETASPTPLLPHEAEEFDLIDPSWNEVMGSAVNLSGGGFKFVTSDTYEIGDLVFLEVFIPGRPPRIMQSVARVVFKNRNYFAGKDAEYYNVAVSFLFIDERDRDAIVSHISNLESLRIRMQRKGSVQAENGSGKNRIKPLKMIGAALLMLVLLALAVLYFRNYLHGNIKNEIQETFESGIRKYLEKFK
ncbi:PilZ-like domain-containing protein [Geobacter sp. SVR]|uniref:PilZ-like domain-containing protein n=1 Tax=Geobacter sp. SVR TaxID=2495594 RepID=UPI00143F0019|nr:PilZ-like domain-containing protein [Geobacter sp. SVR]BCS53600.1 pilus protein PilZ [Geobacter sp. SVR]GCF84203.1 pilus protein PilZ [Geobacter sp. SVR]